MFLGDTEEQLALIATILYVSFCIRSELAAFYCRQQVHEPVVLTPTQVMSRLAGREPSWVHESKLPLWLIKSYEERDRRLAAERSAAAAQQVMRGKAFLDHWFCPEQDTACFSLLKIQFPSCHGFWLFGFPFQGSRGQPMSKNAPLLTLFASGDRGNSGERAGGRAGKAGGCQRAGSCQGQHLL